MEKKDRVIVRMLRHPFKELTKRELKHMEEELQNLYVTIEKTPIRVEALKRRYGFTDGELKWLVNDKDKILRSIRYYKKEGKQRGSILFPLKLLVQELKESKADIVGLIRDGAMPKDVFEEYRIYPCTRAWEQFKRELEDEGYELTKIEEDAYTAEEVYA